MIRLMNYLSKNSDGGFEMKRLSDLPSKNSNGGFEMKRFIGLSTKNSDGGRAIKRLLRRLRMMLPGVLLPACCACAPSPEIRVADAAPILAPPGYYQAVRADQDKEEYECPGFPEPHTGPLVFASKYEGSDASRSQLNDGAEKRYKESVKPIRELESLSADITRDFIRGGGAPARACLLDMLYEWARSGALLHGDVNPIGQAMRKWALAATGAHYLQIMRLDSGLPPADARRRQHIEDWFAALAQRVIAYYSNRGPEKANNHDYWAAWAVMVTAVNLQDRELYGWALDKYRQGVAQIDARGYLPNEIKRKSRALSYQNFALQPLVMLAVFAQANGDLLPGERRALERLAEKVVAGIRDPELYRELTGVEQDTEGLLSGWSLAWIPPWRAYFDPSIVAPLTARVDSFKSTRMGGDMGWLFGDGTVSSGRDSRYGKRHPNNFQAEGFNDDTHHFIWRQRQPALALVAQKPAQTVHVPARRENHAAAHDRAPAAGQRRSDPGLQPGSLLYR